MPYDPLTVNLLLDKLKKRLDGLGSGGGSVPTGTGYTHITGGVQDGAAKTAAAVVTDLAATSGGGTSNYLRADGTWAAPSAGSGSPGGSSTQLQWNNSSSFDGTSGLTWDATNNVLGFASAAQTSSHPLIDATQTWNNVAIAFDAIRVNITDTASTNPSALLNLQVGGAYAFRACTSGRMDLGILAAVDTSLARDANTFGITPAGGDTVRFLSSTGYFDINASAAGAAFNSPGTMTIKANSGAMSLYSNGSLGATLQTTGVLAIGSGTTSGGAGILRRATQLETRLADNSLITTHVHAHKTTAAAPTDAAFTNPVDGIIAVRTSNGHPYVRNGAAWVDVGGDASGPASSTAGRIATFADATGKLLQDSGSTVANVLDRANHTGTQAAGTITGLATVATSGSASDLSAGTLAVARGGTGLGTTPASGEILIGNGATYTKATITAGANVTVTNGAGTITIAASGGGGGSATWTEAEVDFGSVPTRDALFTITDGSVTGASKVAVLSCGKPATGRVAGDDQWDSITYAANPGTGSFDLYASANPGPVVGKRKIQYQLA